MNHTAHNKLISFIWSIADDCLRDVYVRGKYRDVILPMTVLRRLDSILEPTKQAVLEEVEFQKNDLGLTEVDDDGLRTASGLVFYNTSKWTLKLLKESATNNQQLLLANFEEYLNGYSDNVKDILKKFELIEKIRHMANKNVLLEVLEKFVSPYLNLSPNDTKDPQGNVLHGLTNLGMGYVFEELIRKFNEENNEEAGEHFTPREVIELMTHLVFDPIKDTLPPTVLIYDPACGSGGMLTESENFIHQKYPLAGGGQRSVNLYGKEVNDETYAICKSDMMIKGDNPENIRVGSTLSTDEFLGTKFDFMLSNPPYGKSWASEKKYIFDGDTVIDSRFIVSLADYWGDISNVDATPRSSDGQLLFLMEMVSKMKPATDKSIGSRIASVHNGSSLFTGDAGSGESNIRRYIIENDYLDAIIQLPNNLFYNTGITTYIWLLSNNKPDHRQGKVQLIDASALYRKLKKNLGDKNCEFSPQDIATITQTYLDMASVSAGLTDKGEPTGIASQIFNNNDFGYYKVTIERPDRRYAKFADELIENLRFDNGVFDAMSELYGDYGDSVYDDDFFDTHKDSLKKWAESEELGLTPAQRKKVLDIKTWQNQLGLLNHATTLKNELGEVLFTDFNHFKNLVQAILKTKKIKLKATEIDRILNAVSWYDESGEKVIKTIKTLDTDELNTLCKRFGCTPDQLADFGYYRAVDVGITNAKSDQYVIYETNSELRDSESVPMKQSIHDYFIQEVKPHVSESWIDMESIKIGYEISFNKYFYQHKPLRSLDDVASELLALDSEADGLIKAILGN